MIRTENSMINEDIRSSSKNATPNLHLKRQHSASSTSNQNNNNKDNEGGEDEYDDDKFESYSEEQASSVAKEEDSGSKIFAQAAQVSRSSDDYNINNNNFHEGAGLETPSRGSSGRLHKKKSVTFDSL